MTIKEKKSTSYSLGPYLRKLRSQRRLSLTKVEELSLSFKDFIKPSYLSKIETGKFVPALPKLVTLSKIYGVKIQSLIERLDLEEDAAPVDLSGITYEELKQIALQEERSGNIKKALSYFEASLDLSQLSNKQKTADAELDVAIALRNLGKLELSRAKIEEILMKYIDNRNISSRAYIELASNYRNQGHFPLALVAIKEAENIAHPLNDSELLAHILNAKGNILARLQNIDEAIKCYEKAKGLYLSVQNNIEICRVILNQGNTYTIIKEYDKAISLFEESLKLSIKFDFKKIIAYAQSNLGRCYYNKNKMNEASRRFRASNEVARRGDYFNVLFKNYYYLMKICEKRNDLIAANQYKKGLLVFLPKIEGSFLELEEFKDSLDQENLKGRS